MRDETKRGRRFIPHPSSLIPHHSSLITSDPHLFFGTRDSTCRGGHSGVSERERIALLRPPRIERGTYGLEVRCSIQLTYGRLWLSSSLEQTPDLSSR